MTTKSSASDFEVSNRDHAATTRVGLGNKIEAGEFAVPLGIHDRGDSSNTHSVITNSNLLEVAETAGKDSSNPWNAVAQLLCRDKQSRTM